MTFRLATSLRLDRILLASAAAFCLAKILLLAALAFNSQFVMDEYAQGGYWVHIPDDLYFGTDPVKTVLYHYVFRFARSFAQGAAGQMLAARLFTLLLAFAVLGLIYSISRRLDRSRAESLFVVATLLSCSTFMERSFRVRADSLVAFVACASLWVLTLPGSSPALPWLAGLLAGVAFLCTQKAVYLAVALGIGLLAGVSSWRNRWSGVRRAGWYSIGWGTSVFAYAVWFGGLDFTRVLEQVFFSPFEYVAQWTQLYPDLDRFLGQTVARNPLFYALAVGGLASAWLCFRTRSARLRLAIVFSTVLAALHFAHDQPWPYVFVTALPPLALWSPELAGRLDPDRGKRFHLAMLLTLAALGLTFPRNFRYLEHDNVAQLAVVSQAERLLEAEDRYCDGVRMVVSRRPACDSWWDAFIVTRIRSRAASGNLEEIEQIFENRPKLWILNYRVRALAPLLEPHLIRSYVRVQPNLLLTGIELRPGREHSFLNHWPGKYELYDRRGERANGEIYVDGVPRSQPLELGAGDHTVSIPGLEQALFLLPAGLELEGPIPARTLPVPLFGNDYS